jgi:hypothetical protein
MTSFFFIILFFLKTQFFQESGRKVEEDRKKVFCTQMTLRNILASGFMVCETMRALAQPPIRAQRVLSNHRVSEIQGSMKSKGKAP